MYDELVKRLREVEEMLKVAQFKEATNLIEQAANAIEELIKERDNWKTTAKLERDGMWEWFDNYQCIDKEKSELLWCINYMATCDNCKHFGGCCCDHVDEDGKCLGWELLRKPTEEERKAYDEYMAEAVKIAKQVLNEKKE